MVSSKLLQWLEQEESIVVPTLFKPVQFRAIRKLVSGKRLTTNEQRYLRGKMKMKLELLEKLAAREWKTEPLRATLHALGSYYITGFAALKYHGYGWYYDIKVIEVMTTKLEGTLNFQGLTVKFFRVKSLAQRKLVVDKETGLKYAAIEQISKDISFTKNKYAKLVWQNMAARYGKTFDERAAREQKINYAQYGV